MPEMTPVIWCRICTWYARSTPALWSGIAAKGETHPLCSACRDRYRFHYTRFLPLWPDVRERMTTPPTILEEPQ